MVGHVGSCMCRSVYTISHRASAGHFFSYCDLYTTPGPYEQEANVFDLRLLTHVHQISVAITHGRLNRKRIGPGSNPEPLSPAVLSLASMQRLTASGLPCRDYRLPLTPPHGWRPTSVDDLYLDGGLAFSWVMAQLSSSNHAEGLSDPICAFQHQQSDRLRVARDSTLASFGPFQRFLLPKRVGAHTTAFEPLSWRVPGPSPSPSLLLKFLHCSVDLSTCWLVPW